MGKNRKIEGIGAYPSTQSRDVSPGTITATAFREKEQVEKNKDKGIRQPATPRPGKRIADLV